MGKAKKTRKFAEVKRMLHPKDERIKALRGEQQKKKVNVYDADERRAKHLFLCHTHSQIHTRTPHTQHTHTGCESRPGNGTSTACGRRTQLHVLLVQLAAWPTLPHHP